jgi:hypothetical protein
MGVVLAAPAGAQTADSGAFFVRLGRDTIALERYIRTSQQLVAEGTLRTPQTRHFKLTITRKDDGSISWFEVVNSPVAGVPRSAPVVRTVGTYIGDSARVETWIEAVPRVARTVAAKGSVVPLLLPFYSTYELALMEARKTARDTITIEMLAGNSTLSYLVRWMGRDSVTLYNAQNGTLRARTDSAGHLLGMSGEETTFKVEITRARWADLGAFEKRFAAADAAGKGVGALSPRDSMEFDVGTGSAMVNYGRPSKRGRAIFGKLVPWREVWRTGANAATQIEFTNPVEINGVKIPAGKYTLWTIPDPKQWQLIVNKETGQWGTDYDEKQDLARIPVATQTLSVPVETFTIAASPKSNSTTLMTLTWDRTRVLVPLKQVPD